MTPADLRELPDAEFFEYLAALDRRPDAPAETLAEAWSELETRRSRLTAKMDEECAAAGMTTAQADQLKRAAREIFGVKPEDEV